MMQILVYAFYSLGLCTSQSELDYGLSSSDLAKTKVMLVHTMGSFVVFEYVTV